MATTPQEFWQLLGELIEAEKETERLIKEQNQRLNEELGQLGNRLGEFVEYQVRPAAVRLFRERGIDVDEISTDLAIQKNSQGLGSRRCQRQRG